MLIIERNKTLMTQAGEERVICLTPANKERPVETVDNMIDSFVNTPHEFSALMHIDYYQNGYDYQICAGEPIGSTNVFYIPRTRHLSMPWFEPADHNRIKCFFYYGGTGWRQSFYVHPKDLKVVYNFLNNNSSFFEKQELPELVYYLNELQHVNCNFKTLKYFFNVIREAKIMPKEELDALEFMTFNKRKYLFKKGSGMY